MSQFSGKKVLILGSGGLRIGQAGEFDYSGSQCIKALKSQGIFCVLVNPNIATVQTDEGMADRVYLQPLNVSTVKRIIAKERPDGILLGFGGQTALNLGLELESQKVFEEFGVEILGTPVSSIRLTEDRELFKEALQEISVKTAVSRVANTLEEAKEAAEAIGYPIMMRCGFSLGGLGSGLIQNEKELTLRVTEALHAVPQVLIEEYLMGWKEIEYEIVRDCHDNAVTVCNMENMDPMGIHTGESIVVAPSQTLNNQEYHMLREVALKTARHMGIIGECNIQYALNPDTGDYRVIEMNARLSRSSALASKATGYPLAYVATLLSLGIPLHEIKNAVTQKTSAFFEPALDYLVVKIPRWDIHKLRFADRSLGSEMKSVGEVMAIGRSFPEALQKALRMLNIGAEGLTEHPFDIPSPEKEIRKATDRRIFAICDALKHGITLEQIHQWSGINPWFLHHLKHIVNIDQELRSPSVDLERLRIAKKAGFSDKCIAIRKHVGEEEIRTIRINNKITPFVKQIDTLAGEFEAETNYLYLTYHGSESDLKATEQEPIIVLGSGPYCIGSSVEFDWCAVNTAKTLRSEGEQAIIINSNPETVSTDFDESDRLYFEELSLERVRDIADFESAKGIVVSVGGQIANNLALPLHKASYHIMGTSPEDIDRAENRRRFSSLLNDLGIDQPAWEEVSTIEKAKEFARSVGYPILVRPSYVLSGAAMNVVWTQDELSKYLKEATVVSPDQPVVMTRFISNAKELEIDGVADKGRVVIEAISEHVENAGVHSGDATIVLPPQRLYLETIRKTKKITRQIVRALNITGPFNIQFLAKDNEIKVIECNVRASRSFPFVSKVVNHNFIHIASKVLMGIQQYGPYETLELGYVGMKTPQFSYQRLKGANPVAHVEMASTGEVACISDTYLEAFMTSWLATEQSVKGKRLLVSIGGSVKQKLLEGLRSLEENGWEIFATEGTHEYLSRHGVGSRFLYKASERFEPNIVSTISNKEVDLIINIPRRIHTSQQTDGFRIRRLSIDHHIPLITNLQIAQLFLSCLANLDIDALPLRSWQECMAMKEDYWMGEETEQESLQAKIKQSR
ncbi:MAG: carbamoyl phosphate synthase large subunit [Waddliaceae bacterium]|nr:carbamoyl phosphate synthase large subunit [Waddliaceae bacterium]